MGPAELVANLTDWAQATAWVEWLELAGSLGRGAGDHRSDVDAGVGVQPDTESRLDSVEQAATSFAPPAAMLRQPFASGSTHLLTVYSDGRQLSLVVMPSTARTGLPPQALALVDKAGRLSTTLDPATWQPNRAKQREWTFLALIAASDALKHSTRGKVWRALRSLNEARDLYLQLLAAQEQVVYPQYGAVSLENDARPIPDELATTLVGTPDPTAIPAAVQALAELLSPFAAEHHLANLATALNL